ncbi:MAG TPA: phenylalanine--tRNA ligase subunit beta [Candidatus Acidoferrales bacterium]|nr:phenylalanine--tRNA ligase subunit beta [Candidatus Acidoferrales bacterium]
MKILFEWLKDFVDIPVTPQELRSRLAMTGTAIDAIEQTAAGTMLDTEVTINRPDCMGHLGVAREVAAIFRTPLRPPNVDFRETSEPTSKAAQVSIECPDLCGRYTARIIRGVKVGPSPDWLRKRLEAIGQNSINNVVDATNYVLMELGQPLHAFDYDRIAEHHIVIRRAKAGEKMRTLDGIDRTLGNSMCMIADASHSVAIGGVMGGQESEISSSSRNVLLESAWFDPVSVRRTSKALGLRTEASIRFERGCDAEMAEFASRRCAQLIRQLAGGEILAGVIDIYPGRRERARIPVSQREIVRVMGASVPDSEIEAILSALGFVPRRTAGSANSDASAWECTQPSWRADVTREIDLVEEVARHYGLDKFPARLPAAREPAARLPHAAARERLKERLSALGYHEIVTIPFVEPVRDDIFRDPGVQPVSIANPLSEDAGILRTSGIPNMTATLEWNINRGQKNVRLFEIGAAYRWNGAETVEESVLTIGATGMAREKSVADSPREFNFADLKGDLDQIGELAGGFDWTAGAPSWLHAARSGTLALSGEFSAEKGIAGQLSREAADKLKLRQEVFLAEFPLAPFYAAFDAARVGRRFMPISKFPAVERDFSLLLKDGVTFAQVRDAIEELAIAEVISIEAVDLFRGGQVPTGKHSLLVRVTFQSMDATLTESQLAGFASRIIDTLSSRLAAELRAA